MSENKKQNKGGKKPKVSFPIYIVYIAVVAIIIGFQFSNMLGGTSEITKNEFFEYLDKGEVKKILKVEEIEHKAVAFDVFMLCENDQKYLRRVLRLVTVLFSIRISCYMVALLFWARKMPTWKDVKGFWSFMFNNKVGLIPGIRSNYKDYFKEGFHPWDHANQDLVDMWKEKMYRPEHDLGLQRAKAKAKQATETVEQGADSDLNKGLPA